MVTPGDSGDVWGWFTNNINERVFFLFLELIFLDQCIFQATNKFKKFEQKCSKFVMCCYVKGLL